MYKSRLTHVLQCIYFVYMKDSLLTIKIDASVKDEAQKVAKKLGIPLSVVIRQILRDFVADPKEYLRSLEKYMTTDNK